MLGAGGPPCAIALATKTRYGGRKGDRAWWFERKRHRHQLIQHGGTDRTSLAAAILRYRGKPDYIERVIIFRPNTRF
ncbi:hypothetical protein OG410_01285 [Streptomyces sp. NBC_00659]|uniref:hypothetical protein n=1 Tax=Streptomyces sp. NBC_00659 TaxID=2903669 RepID=UPI002E345778|nr:hypothetical protein [Streptomyces sp. NBC_00659]